MSTGNSVPSLTSGSKFQADSDWSSPRLVVIFLPMARVSGPEALWNQHFNLLTQQLVFAVAENPFHLRICFGDFPVLIGGENRVGREFKKRPKALLAEVECFV